MLRDGQNLARPPIRATLPPPRKFLRALQDNFISVWPEDAYSNPVTQVRIGLRHMFTANTPALVRHVLLDNAANYEKTPIARRLLGPALGDGLVTSEGAVWKRHRQLLAPIFVQRRIANLVPEMVAGARAGIARLPEDASQVFDFSAALSAITLDIITRTMFGLESTAETTRIAEDTSAYQRALRPSLLDFLGAPAWVPRPGTAPARRIGARLTETIHSVIARRRALDQPRDDLLALLLEAVDSDKVSLREIRDEIATIFIAGHETTASTLAWTFYLLELHPHIAARVAAELDQVLQGRAVTAEDISRLTITKQVIEEALRLYPPAHSITRRALGPDSLEGVNIPKGAVVIISPWLLHRNRTFWPDPERFDPDRKPAQQLRYLYIPFGAGPRICLGASFAMTEAIVVLATILQRCRVRLLATDSVEPLALITMRPRAALQATVEKK